MIKSITMKNIGSYKETKLETDKRINLIFGFNGTGKTLLSKNIKIDNEYIEWDEKILEIIFSPEELQTIAEKQARIRLLLSA